MPVTWTRRFEIGDKYFQSFPNMNFPFGYQTLQMIQPYMLNRQGSRVRPVLEQLARNATDKMDYYASLDDDVLRSSYAKDAQFTEVHHQHVATPDAGSRMTLNCRPASSKFWAATSSWHPKSRHRLRSNL